MGIRKGFCVIFDHVVDEIRNLEKQSDLVSSITYDGDCVFLKSSFI